MQIQLSGRSNFNILAPTVSLCPYTRQWVAEQVAQRILCSIGLINAAKVEYTVAAAELLSRPSDIDSRSHFEICQRKLSYLKKCCCEPLGPDAQKLQTMLANELWPKIALHVFPNPPNNDVITCRVTFGQEPSAELQRVATRIGLAFSCRVFQQVYSLLPKDYTISLQLFINAKGEQSFLLSQKSKGIVFAIEKLNLPPKASL